MPWVLSVAAIFCAKRSSSMLAIERLTVKLVGCEFQAARCAASQPSRRCSTSASSAAGSRCCPVPRAITWKRRVWPPARSLANGSSSSSRFGSLTSAALAADAPTATTGALHGGGRRRGRELGALRARGRRSGARCHDGRGGGGTGGRRYRTRSDWPRRGAGRGGAGGSAARRARAAARSARVRRLGGRLWRARQGPLGAGASKSSSTMSMRPALLRGSSSGRLGCGVSCRGAGGLPGSRSNSRMSSISAAEMGVSQRGTAPGTAATVGTRPRPPSAAVMAGSSSSSSTGTRAVPEEGRSAGPQQHGEALHDRAHRGGRHALERVVTDGLAVGEDHGDADRRCRWGSAPAGTAPAARPRVPSHGREGSYPR